MHKNTLVDGTVLLRCASTPHDCKGLRDVLVKVDGITEAFITNTEIQSTKYCVGGIVVTTPTKIRQIRKDVHGLRKSHKPLKVDKVALLLGV